MYFLFRKFSGVNVTVCRNKKNKKQMTNMWKFYNNISVDSICFSLHYNTDFHFYTRSRTFVLFSPLLSENTFFVCQHFKIRENRQSAPFFKAQNLVFGEQGDEFCSASTTGPQRVILFNQETIQSFSLMGRHKAFIFILCRDDALSLSCFLSLF